MDLQEKLKQLNSYASKLLRQNFGKGPTACQSFIGYRYLVFYIFDFLTPMENILLQQGHADSIDTSRSIILESILLELKGVIQLFPEQSLLEAEISRISEMVEKVPDRIESYRIASKAYIIVRSGILVPIEKTLIAKGFQQILAFTKDELEKTYLHRSGRFNGIFQSAVSDIFVDWNFKEDKSLMCFILE